jgi:hypothetical protein
MRPVNNVGIWYDEDSDLRIVRLRGSHPSGLVAVPMWVRFTVGAGAVAHKGLIIPLPDDFTYREGRVRGLGAVGDFDRDYELVDPADCVGAYVVGPGGIPADITIEGDFPL